MKKYLVYPFYFLFWIVFFVAARSVFLVYHHDLSGELSLGEIFNVFYYGLRLDFSFAGYICIIPFVLLFLKSIFTRFPVQVIIRWYSFLLIGILSFLTVADLELFTAWGFRMDTTPLQYFKNPGEMVASVSSSPVFTLLFIGLLLTAIFVIVYRKMVDHRLASAFTQIRIWQIALALFLIALLIIPIRGGVQKIPMNLSDVYFSQKLYANQAAVNLPWNIMFSFLHAQSDKNPFDYLPLAEAENLTDKLYSSGTDSVPSILNTKTPNIVIIVLESFTAKWIEHLGGEPGVTPQLDAIASGGLTFTNFYASGDRSEKGLMAILSAYPNQAITSIIKTPAKTQNLPSINRLLSARGYNTGFFYGGELEFANIKAYLLNTGFDRLVDKYEFPMEQRTTSWGVHDEFIFNRFLEDISQIDQPFFQTLFTLSSHEPYDVPLTHFEGSDEISRFKNSIFYTDSLLGDFIAKAKTSDWWENTLIAIVSDHGHHLPGYDANHAPSKFHIPLVFTGGALSRKGEVKTIGSQTDITPTILAQLGIDSEEFIWGKNMMDSTQSFAFYAFNNGFGWVTPDGIATVDNVSGNTVYLDPGFDTNQLKFGKAYMQASYQDFLEK